MKKYIIFIFCFIFIIAGCSNNKEQTNTGNQSEQHNHEEETEHHNHDAVEENNDETAEEHHHNSNLQIEFHIHEAIKVNEEANLSAHIQNETVPLTGANVKFEFWKDNGQAHDYVDATEEGEGAYTATKPFSTTGTYHVKIHVEKEEEHIHDHMETTVEVK